jgi:hypothetical protein
MQISQGKLDRLHRTPAESTALAWMDTGLRRFAPARPTRDASYSVSVRQVAALLPRFFQTEPRGHRPCASLALRLHQTLGRGLSPPSCQTCSAHTDLWTQRTRPQVLAKPQNGFAQASTRLILVSLSEDQNPSVSWAATHRFCGGAEDPSPFQQLQLGLREPRRVRRIGWPFPSGVRVQSVERSLTSVGHLAD